MIGRRQDRSNDSMVYLHASLTCLPRFTALSEAVGAWDVVKTGYMQRNKQREMAVEYKQF